jgi:hypothetical protein
MGGFRVLILLPILSHPSVALSADPEIPSPAPQVKGVFPHGGVRGSSVRVSIQGKNLGEVESIRFARPGLRAEIISRGESVLVANFHVAQSCEPGRHDLRLIAPAGSTIAWFDVGNLSEITETEPNDTLRQAQLIKLPVLVNGVVKRGDYDFFSFHANDGETLTFDLNGTRNGSSLDAVLALYDAEGNELAYNDDFYIFKDPHLTYRFEKGGTYQVRVSGSEEGGSETADYRLSIGSTPYVSHALPSGGRRGSTVTVHLQGINLSRLREVTLGPGLLKGKVVKASNDTAEVLLQIPKSLPPGRYQLHARGAMAPVPFVVGDLPELTVKTPSRQTPAAVELPVVANGVIEAKGEAHYFRFRINHPAKVVLKADAMRLGYPLDPLVSLYDAQGRRIAYQDEPNTNNGLQPSNLDPHLVVDLPAAGDYVARIRDFAYRGGPDFVYRFTMKEAEPDFEVSVKVSDTTLFRGRNNEVEVRVRRLEGWSSPVEIRLENSPAGVTSRTIIAAPVNSTYLGGCAEKHTIDGTDVSVPIFVSDAAPSGMQEFRFMARGEWNGKRVEREARARYKWSGKAWEDAESSRLLATIADPPLLVLEPPGAITISKSDSATFELEVKRFDGGREPLLLSANGDNADLEITADPIPAGATKARVNVRAKGSASSLVLLGTTGGRVLGQSPEIRLERKEETAKGAAK